MPIERGNIPFERKYVDGLPTEKLHKIEKDHAIERGDVPPLITMLASEPPLIPMEIRATTLEEMMHPKKEDHESSKSKSPKKKPTKNNLKTNKATMASIQAKLP